MGKTVPNTIVAAVEAPQKSAVAFWQTLTVGQLAAAPIAETLKNLGIRLVEVPAGDLATEGYRAYAQGVIGDAEIQIECSLPQAEREPLVRSLIARLDPKDDQTLAERLDKARHLVPARLLDHIVYIECPEWCTRDHVADDDHCLEDVYHASNDATLYTPTADEGPEHYLATRIYSDPFVRDAEDRKPHIVLDDESADERHMASPEALAFADNLVALADEIRAQVARITR